MLEDMIPYVQLLGKLERISQCILQSKELTFDYTNHAGVFQKDRLVMPYTICFTSSDHHPRSLDVKEWFMVGWDQERQATRTYAVAQMTF